jgi:flagellar biosynthetic protein FlhB
MAEHDGDKTHEPTPYRRQKAREEGNVVLSRDLASSILLLVALLALGGLGEGLITLLGRLVREQLAGEAWLAFEPQDAAHRTMQIAAGVAGGLLPILGVILAAAVTVNLAQVGFLFLPEKLGLDWNRINPLNNWSRIFSMTGAVNLVMGLLKMGVVATVAVYTLWDEWPRVLELAGEEPTTIALYLASISYWTSVKIAVSLVIIAVLDYGYLWWKNEQDLKMTTQEIKEEMKEHQGDPQIAARRKALHKQMAMRRLSTEVPKADVVVTNPTELAIALQYDPETMAAPIVVAKGAGIIAQRIRRLALESNIPVVERKPLAQALYKLVDIGKPVPADQYAAVAEVIRYVYQLKGKKLPVAA